MVLRPITRDDLIALKRLWRATWHDTYGPVLGAADLHRIDDSLDDPGITRMLAPDGGGFGVFEGEAAIGSVCHAERGKVAYVWGMYVLPARQRTGLGRALIGRVAWEIREAEWVELSTVDARALAFYRHLGFVERGRGEMELFSGFHIPQTSLAIRASALRDVTASR